MADSTSGKLCSPKAHKIIALLTGVWFISFTIILRPYVPTYTEPYVTIIAAFTATAVSGVFWLAANMFNVVRADQCQRNQPD